MEGSNSPDISSPEMGVSPETALGLKFQTGTEASINHSQRNEDAIAFDDKNGFAMVLDGVSSGSAGDRASRVARNFIGEQLRGVPINSDPESVKKALREAIVGANSRVATEIPGGGTTVVVAKFIENNGRRVIIGSVGDSRAYILRDGVLKPITEDDSSVMGMSLVEKKRIGEKLDAIETPQDLAALNQQERAYWETRSGITQMLGDRNPPEVHITHVALKDRDKIIITSDGVHDNLSRREMEQIIKGGGDAAKALVEKSKARTPLVGQHVRAKPDDISAVVIDVEPKGQPATSRPVENQVRKLDQISRPVQPQPERQAGQNQAITQMQELVQRGNFSGYTEVNTRRILIEASQPNRINSLTPDQAWQLVRLYSQYNTKVGSEIARMWGNNKEITIDKFNQAMRLLFQKAGKDYPQKPWWAGGSI